MDLINIVFLMVTFIVAGVVLMLIVGVVCKLIPYREMAATKPRVVFFPKYKKEVVLADGWMDPIALEKKLASFGFKKSSEKEERVYFVRGHILGDFSFSIKHIRLKLGFKKLPSNKSEVTLEASAGVLLDTGDCWTFLTELSEKLGKNIV